MRHFKVCKCELLVASIGVMTPHNHTIFALMLEHGALQNIDEFNTGVDCCTL